MDELTTPRLVIEPLETRHAREWFEALSDPRVSTFFDEPEVTTLEALEGRIERCLAGPADRPTEKWFMWMVRLAAADGSGPVIGRLEATTYDGVWGEIAYVFDPDFWGQGYGSEGTRWLLDHLAATGLVEAWASIHPENSASIGLVSGLGFAHVEQDAARPLQSYDPPDLVYRRFLS